MLCELLRHKEERVKREDTVGAGDWSDAYGFGGKVKESSMTRAIALEYVASLDGEKLGEEGVRELPQYLIRKLLKETGEGAGDGRDVMMIGTYEYCRKLRSWQALCLLDR